MIDNLSEVFSNLSNAVEDKIFGAITFRGKDANVTLEEIILIASEILEEKKNDERLTLPPDMSWYRNWEENLKR